ncbi:MAG: hypothetical protein LC799_28390, partial [Actinobacteria bacterium]|nr:hypothetical protein [Actinomycetota bacterium]
HQPLHCAPGQLDAVALQEAGSPGRAGVATTADAKTMDWKRVNQTPEVAYRQRAAAGHDAPSRSQSYRH